MVTTSSLYCHTNPDVFPEPDKFNPHRWDDSTPGMDKWLVPFSKGKRMCPGKEYIPPQDNTVFLSDMASRISVMELFIVFAVTFRKFHIEPVNTT